MKIILSGVETNNKGAELMLYAILQEIERKFPNAKVYIPTTHLKRPLNYIKTRISLRYWPYGYTVQKFHLMGLFKRLHLPTKVLQDVYPVKGADYFLDASGFHFSDQKRNFTPEKVIYWKNILKRLKRQNCKIVFLSQAFGPAQKKNTLEGLKCISDYSDIIMPREKTSYKYLEESGVVNMEKVKLFKDFTSLVEGTFPSRYEHLRNGICIIPNMRMIDTGVCTLKDYISLMVSIINLALNSGHPVYMLNHEGAKDEELAFQCVNMASTHIDVVSGLNALEVKGMISSAYLVVSSRFHGVASSLNSCVPCLATSWSHKYQELFEDYLMHECILPLNNLEKVNIMMNNFLDLQKNEEVRKMLHPQVNLIKNETKKMWDTVWDK